MKDWNAELAKLADRESGKDNHVVVVDLYTVFDRIRQDPAAYGFTNITVEDPDKADSTALYVNDKHFGPRGQEIIYQVFRHYLTRGWDYANGFAGADKADEALDAAIKAGYAPAKSSPRLRLVRGRHAGGAQRRRRRSQPGRVRGPADARRRPERARDQLRPARRHQFRRRLHPLGRRQGGRLRPSGDAPVAERRRDDLLPRRRGRRRGNWRPRRGSPTSTTSGARTTPSSAAVASAAFDGQTVGLSQTAGVPLRAGNVWLTPWVNLSHAERSIDGFTIANAYLSDVTYGAAEVEETYTTLGLDLAFDPLPLGGDRALNLKGSLAYKRSLHLDDYEVSITEAAFGNTGRARMGRDAVGVLGLDVGAALDLGQSLSFDADYGLAKQTGTEVEQNLMLRLTKRF